MQYGGQGKAANIVPKTLKTTIDDKIRQNAEIKRKTEALRQ